MKMVKVTKADRYSHCSSCGKANEYYCINAYTPDVAKIYKVELSMNDSKIQSFGLCKKCLKKLRKEMKRIIKIEEAEDSANG